MGVLDDSREALGKLVFLSGSYVAAWSWVMVSFSAMHALQGEPMWLHAWTIGTRDVAIGPRSCLSLLLEIAVILGLTFGLAKLAERVHHQWIVTLMTAIEFFPAPIVAELLISYLDPNPGHDLDHDLTVIVVCWVLAILVYFMPNGTRRYDRLIVPLRKSLGFALGVAWNCWIRSWNLGIFELSLYVMVMCVIAARVAAPAPPKESGWQRRHGDLVLLTMKVVCAVCYRDWLLAVCGQSWLGLFVSLSFVVFVSGFLKGLVWRANLENAEREIRAHEQDMHPIVLRLLALLPCSWIMYPWLPLGLLAGRHSSKVKDRWAAFSADGCAMAFSLVMVNIIEKGVMALVKGIGLCDPATICDAPKATVLLQVAVAVVISSTAILAVQPLAPTLEETAGETSPAIGGQAPLLDGA